MIDHLVGQPAPAFKAEAVSGNGRIDQEFTLASLRGRYVLLLFYPLDFTFVCPTEIIAFDEALDDLHARNAEVVGVSVDSVYAHRAWRKTPREQGGVGPIRFPLVADLNKSIARSYGVLHNEEVALRGLFLIDREGIVRHELVNDLSLGRSVDEALRVVDALRFHEERGQVCPANWQEGDEGMESTSQGVVDYLSKFAKHKSATG